MSAKHHLYVFVAPRTGTAAFGIIDTGTIISLDLGLHISVQNMNPPSEQIKYLDIMVDRPLRIDPGTENPCYGDKTPVEEELLSEIEKKIANLNIPHEAEEETVPVETSTEAEDDGVSSGGDAGSPSDDGSAAESEKDSPASHKAKGAARVKKVKGRK